MLRRCLLIGPLALVLSLSTPALTLAQKGGGHGGGGGHGPSMGGGGHGPSMGGGGRGASMGAVHGPSAGFSSSFHGPSSGSSSSIHGPVGDANFSPGLRSSSGVSQAAHVSGPSNAVRTAHFSNNWQGNNANWHNNNWHNGNWHNSYYYYHHHNDFWPFFAYWAVRDLIGYPWGWWGWGGWGYWPYYASSYGYPGYYDYPAFYSGEYSAPAYRNAIPAPAPTDGTATIDLRIPDPNALVSVNGNLTKSVGTSRTFQSPPLESGYSYTYTVRATWEQDGEVRTVERQIPVTPNERVLIDFTQNPSRILRGGGNL